LEESRAILQQGLELVDKSKIPIVQGKLFKNKIARNAANPSLFTFEIQRSEFL
jgi:hypothetical protein